MRNGPTCQPKSRAPRARWSGKPVGYVGARLRWLGKVLKPPGVKCTRFSSMLENSGGTRSSVRTFPAANKRALFMYPDESAPPAIAVMCDARNRVYVASAMRPSQTNQRGAGKEAKSRASATEYRGDFSADANGVSARGESDMACEACTSAGPWRTAAVIVNAACQSTGRHSYRRMKETLAGGAVRAARARKAKKCL